LQGKKKTKKTLKFKVSWGFKLWFFIFCNAIKSSCSQSHCLK